MRPLILRENASPEELHRIALNAQTYTAGDVASHRGTSDETLHYLVHKEIFPVFGMARRHQNETERKASAEERRRIWAHAVSNPALSAKDLVWIYEKVSGSRYKPKRPKIPARDFSYIEIQILKGIGVHRNTPFELVGIIKAIGVNGNPVLRQYDFDMRDEREYENYFIDRLVGRPVAPNPPPKPKSIPGALPGVGK